MRALQGKEKIIYLRSLRRYEIEQAKKRKIGERVLYYKVQVEWINKELKEMGVAL